MNHSCEDLDHALEPDEILRTVGAHCSVDPEMCFWAFLVVCLCMVSCSTSPG